MKDYIIESINRYKSEKQMYIYDKPIQAIKPFENKINFPAVAKKVEELIPKNLLNNIDAFYIGYFKEFLKNGREFNAMYKDGAIYISPDQDNEADLLDDIVHEIAHSLENEYGELIYGDGKLENEFLGKRRTLYHLVDNPILSMLDYNNPEYAAKFDDHIYNEIGYDKLRIVSSGLFYSPYAVTSLREYWANGFENYLLGDKRMLKDLSPILYNIIEQILPLQIKGIYNGN